MFQKQSEYKAYCYEFGEYDFEFLPQQHYQVA